MLKTFLKISLSLLCAIHINLAFPQSNDSNAISKEQAQRFSNALYLIKKYYVNQTDDKKLFETAISGMIEHLDPHSSFLSEKELNEFETFASGEFAGLGLGITKEHNVTKVISALENTPASKAGIKTGDYIIKLDQEMLQGLSLEDVARKMRGKEGSTAQLTILRKGENKPLHFAVIRQKIHIKSIESKLLDQKYGYIHLTQFQEHTAEEMQKAIQQLKDKTKNHLKGLVLDLRNNPGGLLTSAIDVADSFIDAKNNQKMLIVSTKGQNPEANFEATASPGDILNHAPIIVLINNGSASAAEIVAGALKDHRRALVVGTQSFGKGSVQTILPINEKEAIKLTTAFYYTPSGISIQAKGIKPNIYIPNIEMPKPTQSAENDIFNEQSLPGHLIEKNGLKTTEHNKANSNQLMYTDYQLYSALTLLKGIVANKN